MPIYEYQCNACGHSFEKRQKITDQPVTNCPECHKNEVQRLISAVGFQLKGTGWYETDFKKSKKPDEKSKPETKRDNKTIEKKDKSKE